MRWPMVEDDAGRAARWALKLPGLRGVDVTPRGGLLLEVLEPNFEWKSMWRMVSRDQGQGDELHELPRWFSHGDRRGGESGSRRRSVQFIVPHVPVPEQWDKSSPHTLDLTM